MRGSGTAAGLGGARHVETVDVAKGALALARRSWAENGLAPGLHETHARDVAELLKERTDKARRHFERAGELSKEGDLEGAVEELRASIDARATAEAWCQIGVIRGRQERDEDAEKAFREAIKVNPRLAEAWLNLGSIHSRPIPGKPWEYLFFLELEGHRDDPAVAEAMKAAEAVAHSHRCLGSFPRGRRPSVGSR